MSVFFQWRKVKKKFNNNNFFTIFLETTTTYEKQWPISDWYLNTCAYGIIQSKITWFWGYILLPLLCSMPLISPNFDVVANLLPILAGDLFPKLLEKPWFLSCQGALSLKISEATSKLTSHSPLQYDTLPNTTVQSLYNAILRVHRNTQRPMLEVNHVHQGKFYKIIIGKWPWNGHFPIIPL